MCFLIAAGWSALAEEAVRIGGTGSGTALLGKLAALYLEARPDTRIQIMSPSLGSTGGLRALAAGRIDIVVSGRYRLAKPVYLVTRPQADNATSEFVAFLNSPTAKTLLLKYEHLPRFR
jgi:ABC-type phosphate transport system substrate-binding protein